MIRVRLARQQDAPAASEVMVRSIEDLCADDHGNDPERIAAWTANKTPETIVRWIESGFQMLVATRDGLPAGVCGYTRNGAIVLNYVHPDARFHGVSSAMLANMETALAAHGHTTAHLESTATARRFYVSKGWEPDGPTVVKFGMAGYPMRKQLVDRH